MRDIDFDEVTFAVPDEIADDSSSVDDGSAQGVHDGALDAGLIGFGDFDGNGDDPLSQLRKNPNRTQSGDGHLHQKRIHGASGRVRIV